MLQWRVNKNEKIKWLLSILDLTSFKNLNKRIKCNEKENVLKTYRT